jgi:hypothetical protein
MLELIQLVLYSSNPLHCMLCLVYPIAEIPLKGVVPMGDLSSGGGPYSMAGPKNIMRMVSSTTSLIL